ncbi:hypothetical protein FWK35_00030548, partial [Aphis craccivora]
ILNELRSDECIDFTMICVLDSEQSDECIVVTMMCVFFFFFFLCFMSVYNITIIQIFTKSGHKTNS